MKKKNKIKKVTKVNARLDDGRFVTEFSDGTKYYSLSDSEQREYDKLYSDFDLNKETIKTLPDNVDDLFSEIKPDFYLAYPLSTKYELEELESAKFLRIEHEGGIRLNFRLTDKQKDFINKMGIDAYVSEFVDKRLGLRTEKYGSYWLAEDDEEEEILYHTFGNEDCVDREE